MKKLLLLTGIVFATFAISASAATTKTASNNALLANTVTLGSTESSDGIHTLGSADPVDGVDQDTYDEIEELTLDAWDNLKTIDVEDYELDVDIAQACYQKIYFSHPEYGYVNPFWNYTYTIYDEDTEDEFHEMKDITPQYNVSTVKEAKALKENIALEVKKALFTITPQMTDFQKATSIHDYLIERTDYDLRVSSADEETKSQIIYTSRLLTDRVGVCQAYVMTYKYLLSLVGIDSEMISSDSMNHSWNLVKLDGKWYHADLTYDNSISAIGNQYVNFEGDVSHEYMFISDTIMSTKHSGYDLCGLDVSDTTYDDVAWRAYTKTPIVCMGNKYYYMASNSLYDSDGNALVTRIAKSANLWPISNNESYNMPYFSAGLCEYNGKLYYTSKNKIMCYDINTKKSSTIKSDATGAACIYVEDNKLIYTAYVYDATVKQATLDKIGEISLDNYRVSEVSKYTDHSSINIYNATGATLDAIFAKDNTDVTLTQVGSSGYSTAQTTAKTGTAFLWDANMNPIIEKIEF